MLLLWLVEFIGHILLTMLVSLGVDLETDVLVLVFAWLSIYVGCWLLVAAMWAKYWWTDCRMVLVGVDSPEMRL